MSFTRPCRFRSAPAIGLMSRPGASAHLVKCELAEREARAECHRLARYALSPHRLVTDGDAALAGAVTVIDAADPGHADDPAVHLDRPRDTLRILPDALEPFFLLR